MFFREELCEIIMQGIPPNISSNGKTVAQPQRENPKPNSEQPSTSTRRFDAVQELMRAITSSTVMMLNERISQTDRNDPRSSHEQLIGTRAALQRILSSNDSISSTHSLFILEVFNENRDTTSILGVAGVIACLYFKLQVLVESSPDPGKEIMTDPDVVEFIRNSRNSLHRFHRQISPEDLPDDLKIYHLKIRNIDKLLTWWLNAPYAIGKEYRIQC